MRAIQFSLFRLLPLAAAYGGLTRLSLFLATDAVPTVPIWPPAGLGLAACLLLGSRCWPGIFLGGLAAQADPFNSFWEAFPEVLGDTLGVVLGALGILKFMRPDAIFNGVRNSSVFLGMGVLGAPVIAVSCGMLGQWLLRPMPLPQLIVAGWSNWLSQSAGIMMVAPWLLTLATCRRLPGIHLEVVVHWLLTVALSGLIFADWQNLGIADYPVIFLLFPLTAVRLKLE